MNSRTATTNVIRMVAPLEQKIKSFLKQNYMEAQFTNRKSLQLTENGQPLGELTYEDFFFLEAEIKLANAELYEVKQVGIFGTSITVTRNGIEIANLKMNWHGHIVFSFEDGREFVLKGKGIFHNKYILENKHKEKLIQFEPRFNWSKFDYNYDITYDKKPADILLVLLGVYASNYFIASMSGAMIGTG
jgi:hypothetical protein